MPVSEKTSGLPLSKALNSNSREAIQHHFELYKRALDHMFKLLIQDITTITVVESPPGTGNWIYFGDPNTDGTWRIGRPPGETAWDMQRRESGTYVAKGAATA